MRSTLKEHKMTNTIMALRSEKWNYIGALLGVILLLVLMSISAVSRFYDVGMLVVTSQKEINSIRNLHNSLKFTDSTNRKVKVSELQLFGQPPASIETVTNSNYTILGIQYTENDPSQAKVILNTGTGDDKIYHVGDKLGPNVIIDAITPTTVILMQNGIKKKLALTWDGEAAISHAKPAPVNLGIIPTVNRPGSFPGMHAPLNNLPLPQQLQIQQK